MNLSPNHEALAKLSLDLRALEDRAVAISTYGNDLPSNTGLTDLTILALTVYDSPERKVNPEQLKEVLTKCGQFGTIAIEQSLTSEFPYLHLGHFNDSLEQLQRGGIIEIGDPISLTNAGRQIGAAMLIDITANKISS